MVCVIKKNLITGMKFLVINKSNMNMLTTLLNGQGAPNGKEWNCWWLFIGFVWTWMSDDFYEPCSRLITKWKLTKFILSYVGVFISIWWLYNEQRNIFFFKSLRLLFNPLVCHLYFLNLFCLWCFEKALLLCILELNDENCCERHDFWSAHLLRVNFSLYSIRKFSVPSAFNRIIRCVKKNTHASSRRHKSYVRPERDQQRLEWQYIFYYCKKQRCIGSNDKTFRKIR